MHASSTKRNTEPFSANTRVSGLVTEISYANGYPEVVIGAARVMLGDVTSIGM